MLRIAILIFAICLPIQGSCGGGASDPDHYDDAGEYVGPRCEEEK